MNYSPRFAGAVSLDSLATRRQPSTVPPQPAGAGAATSGAPGVVIDVTEASFQADVIELSMRVPVVIDFWAEWCGPCKQLSPILEKLAGESAGSWVLAKIDVDANPRLATAAGVQGIPAVKAVWQGGIVGEFTGAMPEAQVRDWIGQLVTATGAQAAGVDGEAPPPPVDPAQLAAAQAFEDGDYDAAEAAYQAILDATPADPLARGALAGVRLFKRAEGLDAATTRAAADANPDDIAAQTAAADVDILEGLIEEAFARLVATVARTSGADRDKARLHLLGLFEAVGQDDPAVVSARGALSRALF
jgi:putative thioredoxin